MVAEDALIEEEARLEKRIEDEEIKLNEEISAKLEEDKPEDRKAKVQDWLQGVLKKSVLYADFLVQKLEQETAQCQQPSTSKTGRKRKAQEMTKSKRALQDSNAGPSKQAKRSLSSQPTKSSQEITDENLQLLSDKQIENYKAPKYLSGGTLRPYQMEGFLWLKAQYENGINGILADEMGLGKTIQFIALTCHLLEMKVGGPFLVVAPLSTLHNWVAEYNRFAPKVPVVLYHGDKEERKVLRNSLGKMHRVDDFATPPVIVTSYTMAMYDSKYLKNYQWRYIVIDEGHRIKNFSCRLTRELKKYSSLGRLILTGTPLQNNLAELWSLLNFLLPEIFDNLDDFESYFDFSTLLASRKDAEVIDGNVENETLSQLHRILTPFVLRRVKANVCLEIPPKRELFVYAPMTKEQMMFYRAALDKSIQRISMFEERNKEVADIAAVDTKEENNRGGHRRQSASKRPNYAVFDNDAALGEAQHALDTMNEDGAEGPSLGYWDWLKAQTDADESCVLPPKLALFKRNVPIRSLLVMLRKASMHPYLLEHPTDPVTGEFVLDERLLSLSGKMMVLHQLLTALKKEGRKVLIFSQWTSMLDILADYCDYYDFTYRRLDGRDSLDERHQSVTEFNTDKSVFAFLVSTRAGGLGINLTAADTAIIFDSDWNPQCDLQAQDRCHRIGQTQPVIVYRLMAKDTIDERIVERATMKRRLEKMVIHSSKFKSRNISSSEGSLSHEELLELLRYSDAAATFNTSEGGSLGKVISDEDMVKLLDRNFGTKDSSGSGDKDVSSAAFKVVQASSSEETFV